MFLEAPLPPSAPPREIWAYGGLAMLTPCGRDAEPAGTMGIAPLTTGAPSLESFLARTWEGEDKSWLPTERLHRGVTWWLCACHFHRARESRAPLPHVPSACD